MVNLAAKVLFLAALALSVASCEMKMVYQGKIEVNSKMEEPKMEEQRGVDKSVQLDIEIELRDKSLQVAYKVKNKSAKPIYLFNVLWDFSPSGQYVSAPKPAYTCLRDDGTFVIAKQIPPLPKSKRVELKIVPFATKVEAGGELSDKFEISVPASEYNPYFPKTNEKSEELKTAEAVLFVIQYIAETEELEVKPALLENALNIWHPDFIGKTETLSAKPKPITFQVKRRTDKFERF